MATFYISPTGDDTTGDGSEGNPWYNVAYAFSNSGTADEIIAKEGTYTKTLDMVDFDNRTLRSENNNPNATIMDFGGVTFQSIFADELASLSGIKFVNLNGSTTNVGTFRVWRAGTTISDCIFEDCITTGGTSGDGRGGFFQDCNAVVSRCKFKNIYYFNGNPVGAFVACRANSLDFTMESCTYYNNGVAPAGTKLFEGFAALRANSAGAPINFTVKNSIVSNTTPLSYYISEIAAGAFNLSSTYSCLHNANYLGAETGTITSDPKLVDPDNGFFDLAKDSPCIGTGIV